MIDPRRMTVWEVFNCFPVEPPVNLLKMDFGMGSCDCGLKMMRSTWAKELGGWGVRGKCPQCKVTIRINKERGDRDADG